MAWSLQWYKNSLLAWMWNTNAQQAMMNETPWFNMFANVNTNNVAWMDILSPTERQRQEYDQNAMRAEALNKEVEIWLWSRIDPVMSDSDKQRYLNSLTKNQYNQMLKYKNEWYWFMASKELLENSYKLADPNATWLMKYKDYADKDAYYYNNSNNGVSDFIDRYISNPIWKVAKWWNEDLWFAEDAQNWNMNFADRFANLTLGNIINWLDTAAKWVSWIVDESESKVKTLYDKVVKWYDTDWDFYDKDREETIVDKIIDTAYGAWQWVLWAVGLVPWALPFTAALSTEPWEKIGGLTIWTLSKLVDATLNLPWIRAWYNLLSDDSKDKVSTWLAMIITGKAAKAWGAKINAKAEPYIRATKEMVQNWLNKWAEYAKVQADFENFSKTKWWTEREDWTFVETENYNPWYRGRVASEFWEWFKEGVKEKFNNPNWTNLSEIESTTYQEWLQWWEIPTWWENVNKTNTNNTQSNWIVNTIWASQLRQWNKMNKVQWIKFANRYWTDYWTWMAQRGFNQSYDNNINQLIDYDKYMQNQKRQALWAITQRYREPAVDDMLLEAINRAEYIKSDDLWKLQNLALKNEQWWLTPADIDYVRQRFWYNFPLRFDGTDIAWTTQRNNNMYMRVKDVLERIADENWIPQLRDINREIAATHHIIEWTTRYYNWLATNDIISLKDLITLASTVANPSARPLFVIQQAIKMPKVKDAILNKLIKGKTTEERNQIKIDFDKIRKIQDEAEQRRMLEEWIAKWNLKVEEATKAMQNRLPENITQWGVSAWDRWFMATYWDWPTYQELWLWKIRETASPQFLLRAIIEQLKEANLIKDINTTEAINQILANLSPEAQAKLAQIANKLANWRELTPEEWKVVEKLADIIRQDQDTITDVQQPWLFDWLDNWEPTDINNTNLPTNPTNNGWQITEWETPWIWGGWGTQENWPYNEVQLWWANWWWNQEILWRDREELWWSKSELWKTEEVIEIAWDDEYLEVLENIKDNNETWLFMSGGANPYKRFTNQDKNMIIGITKDWRISELIKWDNAPKGAWDELVLRAIEEWWNKAITTEEWLVEFLEKFGYRVVGRDRIDRQRVYFMIHNWENIEWVRWKIWTYPRNVNLSRIKEIKYKNAMKYMNDMLKENIWYKLTKIEWWDWLQNYEDFGNKFKTEKDITDYLEDSFNSIDNNATYELFNIYNKELAESKEIYNWHIDTKDLNIIYREDPTAIKSDGSALAVFRRWKRAIEVWETDWFTLPHEFTHYNDYKFWKELTGRPVALSVLAKELMWNKRNKPKQYKDTRDELIWEFVDIYERIDKYWFRMDDIWYWNKKYWVRPKERFARFWEAFINFVEWWEPISTWWEQFTNLSMIKYAEWLWKLDKARVEWELYNWMLWEPSGYIDDIETERRWRHWSPNKFDKFDSSHMWEWEWEQAHGWWHYIAVQKDTAEWYATLKQRRYWTYDFTIDGVPYRDVYKDLSPEEQDIFDTFKAIKVNDRTTDEAWERTENSVMDAAQYRLAKKILSELPEKRAANPNKPKEYYDDIEDDVKSYIDKYEKYQDIINSLRERVWTSSNMYEVEIPDPVKADTPTWSNYLEEDGEITEDKAYEIMNKIYKNMNREMKPLEKATMEDVRKLWEVMQKDYAYAKDIWERFYNSIKERIEEWEKIEDAIRNELTWYGSMASKHDKWLRDAWLFQKIEHTGRFDKFSMLQIRNGRWLYDYISHFLWGPKEASRALEKLWYDWIHYFGNRDGEAYVIFNDDAIEIKSHKAL